MTYPFHGHDKGLVIDGPDTGFAERRMTAAELAAREPALKIARDIYRHANFAGVCYVEIWRTIADAYQALDYVLPYVHVDVRDKALQIARGEGNSGCSG